MAAVDGRLRRQPAVSEWLSVVEAGGRSAVADAVGRGGCSQRESWPVSLNPKELICPVILGWVIITIMRVTSVKVAPLPTVLIAVKCVNCIATVA